MRFTSVIALVATAPLALAVNNFTVVVGGNGTLTFSPNVIPNAAVGDTITFQFQSKNHSLTQSTFAQPCVQMSGGLDSGFQNISAQFADYSFTMNATDPLWFFCAQTNPVDHCQKGMVFAVNPTDAKNFTAFQTSANSSSSSSPGSPSGSGSLGSPSSSSSAGGPSSSAPASGALDVRASAAGVLAAVGIAAGLFL